MKYSRFLISLAAGTLVLSPALAFAQDGKSGEAAVEQVAQSEDASIPFANHGGVWNWQTKGSREVYFQDSHKQWYKATLFSPAFDLPYVEFIGLDTSPGDRLDKWSAIYVKGQRYPFTSFVKVDGPPSKKSKKHVEAADEAKPAE